MDSLPMESGTDDRVRFLVKETEDPLAEDAPNVIANLTGYPKKISSVYVYDKAGTEFFERQCETPECRISSDWTPLISSEWDHPISG
jgi:uncharacterized SAM-dependent methyltransferase